MENLVRHYVKWALSSTVKDSLTALLYIHQQSRVLMSFYETSSIKCSSGTPAWLPPSSEGVYERCGGSAGYGWDIIYWQSPSKMCSWKHWLQGYCAAKAVTKQKPAINIGGDTGEGSPFIQISGAGAGAGEPSQVSILQILPKCGCLCCSEQCSASQPEPDLGIIYGFFGRDYGDMLTSSLKRRFTDKLFYRTGIPKTNISQHLQYWLWPEG